MPPHVHARPHASADANHGSLIERRLRRYSQRAQGLVRVLAGRHPRLADLAVSFPALLFALAVPRQGIDVERAIAHVIAGCSLADVAQAAGVPLCLRKLPVDALVKPLPALPDGELFRRRIANHLPRSPKLAPTWLMAVADAATWGHEPLAIWIARELTRNVRSVTIDRLRLVSLWAWFSLQPGTCGHRLIDKPWHSAMRFKTALAAAEEWRTRAMLHVSLGAAPIADMWLTPGHIDGYDFVPLDSGESIAAEAAHMENCLCIYGPRLAHNIARLWSVRRDGQRIATLRVARVPGTPLVGIRELRLAQNKDASVDIWWAATRWLHQHDLSRVDTRERAWNTAPLDGSTWRRLWRPYWLAKRRIPWWLPLKSSPFVLAIL
jgi:hypothetical protein